MSKRALKKKYGNSKYKALLALGYSTWLAKMASADYSWPSIARLFTPHYQYSPLDSGFRQGRS